MSNVGLRLYVTLFWFSVAAWKTPIRVNPEILDKFKTSKRPLEIRVDNEERTKRLKLREDESKQISSIEQAPLPEEKSGEKETDRENKPPPVVLFTGFTEKFRNLVNLCAYISISFIL